MPTLVAIEEWLLKTAMEQTHIQDESELVRRAVTEYISRHHEVPSTGENDSILAIAGILKGFENKKSNPNDKYDEVWDEHIRTKFHS